MTKEEAQAIALQGGAEGGEDTVAYLTEHFPREIGEFTKEDFLDGKMPFEYIDTYKFDNVKREQVKQKVKARAVELKIGARTFERMWADYKKANPDDLGSGGTTNFPDQPLALRCGKWLCDGQGVRTMTADKGTVYACPHPIMPVEILKNLDTGAYKVRVAFRRNNQWHTEIFDRTVLSQKSKIVDALSERGVAVNSENARNLVLYFADIEEMNIDGIPENACISRLGWREYAGAQMFVPYTRERLIFDGEAIFRKRFESIRESGDFQETLTKWHGCISENVRHNSVSVRIIFAASAASVLVKLLGCNNFIVHIWGETGTGKTVLSMCAASIWGNPAVGEYISSFNTTAVGIEKNLGFLQNLPLILDELQIADERDVKKLVYLATEGTGRSRGSKYGGLQSLETWANCTISTGERPITSMISDGGAHNRVIEIECKEQLFKDPHAVARCVSQNYGVFGRILVIYLSKKENLEAVCGKYHAFFDELIAQYNITQKQAYAAALILAADYAITECAFDKATALTAADIAPYLKSEREISANVRGYEYLCEQIAANQAHFTQLDKAIECWGEFDGDAVYIIKSVFNRICTDGGFSPASLLSWLSKNNLIERRDNHTAVLKRIGGVAARCVHLTMAADNVENLNDFPDF